MPVLSLQQSGWDSNVYVVTTTRVFILAGVVQLGRSLYHLISRYSGAVTETAPSAQPSQRPVGVDLTTLALDTLSMTSMDQDIDIDVTSDLELGIQQPRRSYQSHRYPYRPRTLHHEQPHRPQTSANFESPTATVKQCTSVCSETATVGINNTRSIEMSERI